MNIADETLAALSVERCCAESKLAESEALVQDLVGRLRVAEEAVQKVVQEPCDELVMLRQRCIDAEEQLKLLRSSEADLSAELSQCRGLCAERSERDF